MKASQQLAAAFLAIAVPACAGCGSEAPDQEPAVVNVVNAAGNAGELAILVDGRNRHGHAFLVHRD